MEATVNLREGTRRLALLLGVIGAILGGFASCAQLRTILSQRARHNSFEQFASSNIVQQKRKVLRQTEGDAKPTKPTDEVWIANPAYTPPPDEVNTGGIKTIRWASMATGYAVESIDTEDGQTLYQTPAPSAWQYLLVVAFPSLGFFTPWGVIRAIFWVGAGFIQQVK